MFSKDSVLKENHSLILFNIFQYLQQNVSLQHRNEQSTKVIPTGTKQAQKDKILKYLGGGADDV